MTIHINPVLIPIGPLAVRWFGLLALVGLGLAIWLSLRALRRAGLRRGSALDAFAWALPVALVSARLAYVTGYWDYYLTNSAELWRLNIDGLSLWGGLLGGLAVAAARLRADPRRRLRILDAVAPNIAFGIAVGRLGEFLDGAGQGAPAAQLAWATQYANRLAATPDFGVPRHPLQVYDALAALIVGGLLLALPRGVPAGTRLATLLVLYGAARVAFGTITLEPAFLFGLQMDQLLALVAILVGVLFGIRPLLERRRPLAEQLPPSQTAPAAAATAEEHPVAV